MSSEDEEIGRMLTLLWQTDHALEQLSKRMLKSLGVTGPQRMVLRVAARRPNATAGGIAEAARLHPSTLTGILDRLVRSGLLSRERDPEDGRRVRLAVTGAGAGIVAQPRGTVEGALLSVIRETPAEDRAAVERWMARFVAALDAERVHLESES